MVLRALSWSDCLIIGIQLVILWNYLGVGSDKEEVFAESLRLMKGPLFIVGTLVLGLFIPLILHLFVLTGGDMASLRVITGVLLVIGGISLRFSVIRAGVYLPRHSL